MYAFYLHNLTDGESYGEEKIIVCHWRNKGGIHQGRGVSTTLDIWRCARRGFSWIGEGVIGIVTGNTGLPFGAGEIGVLKNRPTNTLGGWGGH